MSFARHSSLTDLTQRSAFESNPGFLPASESDSRFPIRSVHEGIRRTSYLVQAVESGSLSCASPLLHGQVSSLLLSAARIFVPQQEFLWHFELARQEFRDPPIRAIRVHSAYNLAFAEL